MRSMGGAEPGAERLFNWGVVIAAAGHGTRFGQPKQLLELAGKPMLAWSIETFAGMAELEELVVVTEAEYIAQVERLVHCGAARLRTSVVRGGADRQESVRNGLGALSTACTAVMVHDGARPLVHADDIRRAMRIVREGSAAVLGVASVDTMKLVDADLRVTQTLDRTKVWAVQTPQLAAVADLQRAFADAERSGFRATDETSLLERVGVKVTVVAAQHENFKVTYPLDLERAETILRKRSTVVTAERG